MAIANKTYTIDCFKNNTVNVVMGSQENLGRRITFKLERDGSNLFVASYNSYAATLYLDNGSVQKPNVKGTIDYSSSTVSFEIPSGMLVKAGVFPCFITIVKGNNVLQYFGMKLDNKNCFTHASHEAAEGTDSFTQMQSDVASLQKLVSDAISSGDTNLEVIEARTTTDNKTYATLKGRLDSADKSLNAVDDDLKLAEEDIIRLEKDMKETKEDIETLEAQIDLNTSILQFLGKQNIMVTSNDFTNTNISSFTPSDTNGTLTADNGYLIVQSTGTAGFGVYGKLSKPLTFDAERNKTALIKLRCKATRSNSVVQFCWRYDYNGEILTSENILVASDLEAGKESWDVLDSANWVTISAIVGVAPKSENKSINELGLIVKNKNNSNGGQGLVISNFEVFYSGDTSNNNFVFSVNTTDGQLEVTNGN